MIILGIETSCDETAISIVEASGDASNPHFRVLGAALHSQVDMHTLYGGVYPNLAKREHIKNLPIVLEQALEKAGMEMGKIDAIAVTVGPGLEPALWTGINFAEELSEKYGKPLVPTNHMEGHIASVLISTEAITKHEATNPKQNFEDLEFPIIALLISGGHTELVLLKSWGEKEIIGHTVDDAVGEAFDKVARMLGLPYPGGPAISALAEEARKSKIENRNIKLPRPMIRSGDLNFSFSGLKTAVLYLIRDLPPLPSLSVVALAKSEGGAGGRLDLSIKQQIAREFEDAVIEVLIEKTKTAIALHNPHTLIIGGGVIANNLIRQRFEELVKGYDNLKLKIPEKSLTTDNATMIAMAAFLSLRTKSAQPELRAQGNLKYL